MNKLVVKTQKNKKRAALYCVVILMILICSALLYNAWFKYNHAQEIEKPIRVVLLSKGAKLLCAYGDSGRGISNTKPWYKSFYTIPRSLEDAERIVKEVADSQGYTLIEATLEKPGPISVAPEFISEWLYDNTSRKNPYLDLEEGKISLEVSISHQTVAQDKWGCEQNGKDEKNSIIFVNVSLPEYKR